ncbi:TPA: hypothetical protein N0F65_005516 [Lagenidium giganteum]|uniref:Battenin n=1 Tax=Lagenidium giganteum TaxID=4803 RepID=A0AAV2YGD1_9STRA|nr:TPA: hypothetical protein N0F65_005516 [Lagenidium giganteum]
MEVDGNKDGRNMQREERRNLIAFWLLGFINNVGYVIMIAGAQEIVSGGVGLVYFFDIFPGLVVKLTGPYWFHLVSYRDRTLVGAMCMLLSFLVVAFGKGSLPLQLLGVSFSGVQSGMMEASYLALASHYESRTCLTCWASGTGLAGVGGYLWVALFHIWLGLSFSATLVLASVFPMLFVFIFMVVLDTSHIPSRSTCGYQPIPSYDDSSAAICAKLGAEVHHHDNELRDAWSKARFTLTLWPYMLPLTIVYFAEYAMQTGVWSTIGFPVTSAAARAQFYSAAGMSYQIGVFLSRSSGVLFQASRAILFAMPILQIGLLVLFTLVSAFHFWYNWSLIVLCFCAGLLGGGVYVNAYTLLSLEVAPSRTEFALGAVSVADTVGVMLADFGGLFLQGCLYSVNRIPGATISIAC